MGEAGTVRWSAKARPGELFDGMSDQQVASPTGMNHPSELKSGNPKERRDDNDELDDRNRND